MFLEEQTSLMWGKKCKYGKVRGKSLTIAATKDLKELGGWRMSHIILPLFLNSVSFCTLLACR